MPQLNGIDLITMMSHLTSHFILVTCGDASNWIQANCPLRTQQLQKPFSGRDLAQILQTIDKQLSTSANSEYMKKPFFTLLLGLLVSFALTAQQLNVSLVIRPPYSTNLADYIDQGNNVLISAVNMSGVTQQIKLIPSLEGNNGVIVKVK